MQQMQIQGTEIQIKEYQGKRVVTLKDVDAVHQRKLGTASRNFNQNRKPRAGFRLHPAFYDASGNEIDYFLTSAYEGSIYDASASAYLLNDEQVMNTGEDKFS